MLSPSKRLVILLVLLFTIQLAFSQYASRKLSKKQETYIDSLKQIEYNHIFPIWGQQAYRAGFDIPYPAGIMVNFLYMSQGLILEDMQLGIQTSNVDIPLTEVDFIEFGENTATVWSTNIRPDLWIFPFLNVYGVFGYGKSRTDVSLTAPIPLFSSVEQNISTAGFGITGAFGLGPVWVAMDGNWTWNKPELLEKPVFTRVFGIRVGHSIVFKNKPDRNIAIWVGAMRIRMTSETVGEIQLKDALPQEFWDNKDAFVADYWEWYESLGNLDPKKAVADKVLNPIIENIDQRNGESTVRYGMNKKPTKEWNMVAGAQFQLNKRFIFRTEAGFLGDRESLLLSVNYRFKI